MKKYKLEFTFDSAIKVGACERGILEFKAFLEKKKIKYTNKTKFNLKLLVESNFLDALWALQCTLTSSCELVVKFSKKCASRAARAAEVAYAVDATRAACAAEVAYAATVKAATRVENVVVGAAARAAARTATYARDVGVYAGVGAACEKQQQRDLLSLLED